ncbi:hypothetical protein [Winogradskyella aurantia]|uniref:Uncharacterized protein n=1 Tax=Winogradskyella aurantia TaxID=1915063 RepID=A0A265UVN4_9FLAO|nr:hypothetical protein [Winogradskyella aurantia]OZV69366.1 hypothetical protein CA834_07905 [Winogradskyella aurantia]
MRTFLLSLLACLVFQVHYGQETYTINGETLELKTEIEGELDLLWNIIDNEYRYFVKTNDGSIVELKNTKNEGRTYQEEYKSILSDLTQGMSTEKLKLTLYSLRNFIDHYNASVDASYISSTTESDVQFRLGVSGGLTNNPFVSNPDNTKNPLIGAELEIYEANVLPRHSGFLQLRHAFDSDDFPYAATEFSMGYRYRIINQSAFSIYGQVKLATLNFSDVTFTDANNMERNESNTAFDIPFIFGIGSDIKVGKNSFITIIYGELFAIFLDNQGNFSTDISIGYKFNL